MTLIRWNPIPRGTARELQSFQDDVSRLFEGLAGRSGISGDLAPAFSPAVDVEENAEEFVFRADLPGISPKDVKVNLMGDTLTVRGERKQEEVRKGHNVHRVERRHGAFERTFTFDTPVRSEGIQARYRDGVLEIVVPKAEEAKVREIEVQVAS